MKKNINSHINLALAVTMAGALTLAGCGKAEEPDTPVTDVDSITNTEIAKSIAHTEAITSKTDVSNEEKTEITETEPETNKGNEVETEAGSEAETESETVSESNSNQNTEPEKYTFTEINATMYATSSVNVRNLPSTDGSRLGSLATNQSVTVTGKCNETGWYRIVYNNSEGFVSNKYLSETAPTVNSGTSSGKSGNSTDTSKAASSKAAPYTASASATASDGFNRATAQEIWEYVNAERTAAGLNPIAWDENIYNFACQRAQAIVNDFSHNGHGNYAENIFYGSNKSGYDIHMCWYNSPGHHTNYMTSYYTHGACAVYVHNGVSYAVENFSIQ